MSVWKDYWLQGNYILDDRYEVISVLGEGGFGITYLCENIHTKVKVAIKEFFNREYLSRDGLKDSKVTIFDPNFSERYEREKKRFLRESRIISDYKALEGVVNILDYFEANETAYIVMEYIEGSNIRDYIKDNDVISYQDILLKMWPIMEALSTIHDCGIVHRDIGPNNIMVDKSGAYKLIDFGSAKDYGQDVTTSRSIILTGGYAPPEQYSKESKQGPWTDVYALASTIYYCVTKSAPDDSLTRMLYDELPGLNAYAIDYNEEFEAALLKGMSLNPEERYQSMKEMMDAFRPFLPVKEDPELIKRKRMKKTVLAICIVLVFFAFVFVLGYKYYQTHKEEVRFKDVKTTHILLSELVGYTNEQEDESLQELEERLSVFSLDKGYMIEKIDDQIYITLEEGAFPESMDIGRAVKRYLSRPCQTYLVSKEAKGDKERSRVENVMLTPSMIEDIKIKEGRLEDIDVSIYEDDRFIDDYTYYEIKLNDDAIHQIKSSGYYKDLDQIYLYMDIYMEYSVYYYILGKLDYDKKILYMIPESDEDNVNDILIYHLTHESNMIPYSVDGYDVNTKWDSSDDSLMAGVFEVDEKEIPNSYTIYYYKGNEYDDHTLGTWYSSVADFKVRMDSLNIPYAFGVSDDESRKIAIKVKSDAVDPDIMRSVLTAKSGTILVGCNYETKSLMDYEIEGADNEENPFNNKKDGTLSLTLKTDAAYKVNEIETLTKDMLQKGYDKIYLYVGSTAIASADLEHVIKDGTLTFDDFVDEDYERNLDVLCMLDKILSGTTMDVLYNSDEETWVDNTGRICSMYEQNGFMKEREDEVYKADAEKIYKIFPEASITREYGNYYKSKILYIDLDINAVPADAEGIEYLFTNIKKMYQELNLDDGRYGIVQVRFMSEGGKQSYLGFKRIEEGHYMQVYGYLYDEYEPLTAYAQNILDTDQFYKDRK